MDIRLDAEWLNLLTDMQSELAKMLNSLGGAQSNGLLDNFRFYSVSHMNRATEGFVFLRTHLGVDASKLLIRPAIEAMFRLLAVRKQPNLLYRIVYKYRNDLRKWTRPAALKCGSTDYDAVDEERWNRFRETYRTQFPEHEMVDQELSVFDAAKAAGVHGYYDTHYRLYCNFTHGSLGAMMGALEDFESEDSRTMALCVLAALEELHAMGAAVPNYDSFRHRMAQLGVHLEMEE